MPWMDCNVIKIPAAGERACASSSIRGGGENDDKQTRKRRVQQPLARRAQLCPLSRGRCTQEPLPERCTASDRTARIRPCLMYSLYWILRRIINGTKKRLKRFQVSFVFFFLSSYFNFFVPLWFCFASSRESTIVYWYLSLMNVW